AQAVIVTRRAAGENERRERQRIGVGNPLRLDKRCAEIGADRRYSDRNHRSVDKSERGSEDRRDQDIAALRPGTKGAIPDRRNLWLGIAAAFPRSLHSRQTRASDQKVESVIRRTRRSRPGSPVSPVPPHPNWSG